MHRCDREGRRQQPPELFHSGDPYEALQDARNLVENGFEETIFRMATLDSPRTGAFHAAARALDDAIESAIKGVPSHVPGTTFVPADLAGTGRVAMYRRTGPVTIVDAEGNETRLSQDHLRETAIALLVIGVVAWLLSRRPQLTS